MATPLQCCLHTWSASFLITCILLMGRDVCPVSIIVHRAPFRRFLRRLQRAESILKGHPLCGRRKSLEENILIEESLKKYVDRRLACFVVHCGNVSCPGYDIYQNVNTL